MTDQLKLANQVCFPVYTLAKEIINQYRPILKEMDLTYPQYLVMMVLWESKEQTVSEIGEKLNLDSGTLTPLLKRLETKKLITRKRKKTDERVVAIALTPEGFEKKEMAELIPERVAESLNISMEELNELKRITEKVIKKIKS
ncbi:MarR family winged helix-turn-helix transcriptional regulator [Brumimicrobium aurantiacum]|uniref:MarR family transcriptional regulator n=1 Tax=Brumimicrobium aurantiacum TaxID=1737063 RepID=A0A3E1EV18_9FLAO|nr:MarR family transcriptional regulator [Brumimicrobium aurantiacum]RFC53409.1 MarR family transcriptional regulator [Brumimicrobium aurantiacum]